MKNITTEYAQRWSPPIVLDTCSSSTGRVHIIREDLLVGGTKQRAALPFLFELKEQGYEEVVYASPFCGFAQVALAVGCAELKMKATIYCERCPAKEGPHEFSRLAESLGASIKLFASLDEAEAMATEYGEARKKVFKIPLGFQHPRFVHYMKERIGEQYAILIEKLGRIPERIWLPVGSGTLAGIFNQVADPDCQLLCVNVRVLCNEDDRIRGLTDLKRVTLYHAEEKFCEPAIEPAPIPSNIHYDAKLWRLINQFGKEDDVWWNVAR